MRLEAEKLQIDNNISNRNEIFPKILTQLLKGQGSEGENKIRISRRDNYSKAVSALRTLPAFRQEKLLKDFFEQEINDLHNSEKLASFLAMINNASWFAPSQNPDITALQKHVDSYFFGLNHHPFLRVRLIDRDWKKAWEAEKFIVRWLNNLSINNSKIIELNSIKIEQSRIENHLIRFNQKSETKAVLEIAAEAAKQTMRASLKNSSRNSFSHYYRNTQWKPKVMEQMAANVRDDAVLAAKWIIAEDKMQNIGYTNGNPYLSLIEIYNLGFWPIGPVEDNFVIFVPPPKTSQIL